MADDIIINFTDGNEQEIVLTISDPVGEYNDAENIGSGSEIYKGKNNSKLQLRTLIAGDNITLNENTNDITINATVPSGADATSIQSTPVTETAPTDGSILVYREISGEYVLEAKPISGSNPAWGDITGTLANQTDLVSELSGKANSVHTHVISDVTDLSTQLSGKANTVHTHSMSDITNLSAEFDKKANAVHTHTASNITDFSAAVLDVREVGDLITDSHTHSNKSILDATTVAYTTTQDTKLSGIETGAQVNTVTSVASKTGAVTLEKADVGLNNVINSLQLVAENNLSDIPDPELARMHMDVLSSDDVASLATEILEEHSLLTDNPHEVTKDQVGLSNVDNVQQLPLSQKGAVSGVAELDSNGKVPLAQINDALIGQVSYQGLWNATTNTPTLPTASTVKGHYYVTDVGGTYETIVFEVGDWVISNGVAWQKVDNTDAVTTVHGRTGNVVAATNDYTWAQINKSTSNIADITTKSHTSLTDIGTNTHAQIDTHIASTSNPHSVTKTQVGLSNVDNTSDVNKPISTATQTALNAKQATITGGATTITSSNLTASRALVSDASGKVGVSAVTSTTLGYLDATSSVQTQLNAKQATITGGATTITSSNLTTSRALVSDASGKVGVSAVTSTELGYVAGVTSAVQTQINAKVGSDPTGVTGADAVTNIISLTQAEYDTIGSPNASTVYIITD
jgi:hypothetical protein